ncbi:MAG: GreA/GreB family elongation factor [Sphingomonas sp.]|uniref:GreA/GreB family elongation factor n=1 Tax=Sphingomonas sp. TaxID=28214 RepID=UPI0018404B0E|nr:GreA/GreB family elongation factor [Sphingomonas sp.]MBA3666241.1 GreA/GreB family elongation factor [Sphingomonas sp.]
MSVAFRRESDEEHLEPKFELPMPPGPNLVTERGYALIEARHDAIEAQLGAELGEEERKALLRDARYWRNRLASAQIAAAPKGDMVAIGTRVTFVRAGETRAMEIVGHDEADPAADRIAFSAPLARALLGAEVGEEVELPGSGKAITVIAIEVR